MRRTNEVRDGRRPEGTGRLGRDWLREHTIADVRDLAADLASQGDDMRDLLNAVDGLESVLRSIDAMDRAERRGKVEVPG